VRIAYITGLPVMVALSEDGTLTVEIDLSEATDDIQSPEIDGRTVEALPDSAMARLGQALSQTDYRAVIHIPQNESM